MASSSIRSSSSILLDPLPDFSFLPVSIGCRVILMASRIHSSFQAILSKHLQNETSQLQLTDSQTSRSNASDYSLSAAACIVEQLDFSNLSSWLQSASDGALSAHQTKSLKLEPMRADSNFTSSATETEGELEKLKLRDDTESKHVPLKKKTGHTKLPISATKILQAWFEANIVNPYPTELQKKALIEETGLPPAQVTTWLTNTRKRAWKKYRAQNDHNENK